jgi:glycosyltransferase involved in cell wall biosynthesis
MKLLLYSHFFAPSIGGVETLVRSLTRGLAVLRTGDGAAKFSITLITQTPARDFDDRTLPFPVVRQPSRGQLWKLIRNTDVLHVAGTALLPMLLARLARKPVVVEHHGFQSICPNGQLLIEPAGIPCPGHFMAGHHNVCLRCNSANGWPASIRLWMLTFARRFLCKHISANITPTQWLGDLVHLPHVVAIPHGLENSRSVPNSSCPYEPAAMANPPVIAFAGRLVTTKGVSTLIEAAQILRSQSKTFTLLIAGDGSERHALEESVNAAHLGEITHFAGRLGGSELDAALAGVSIVVVPSLGGEVFGLVVAENMLRGLPVVASNLGAFVEVLGPAGLTFEVGNATALAAQLARLLDDPELRKTLGQQARQRAAQFCDFQNMLAAHERVYHQAFAKMVT